MQRMGGRPGTILSCEGCQCLPRRQGVGGVGEGSPTKRTHFLYVFFVLNEGKYVFLTLGTFETELLGAETT